MTADSFARFLRFGVVGVAGAAIHMAAFALIQRATGAGDMPSWTASFLVAATAGWALNRSFTFKADPTPWPGDASPDGLSVRAAQPPRRSEDC